MRYYLWFWVKYLMINSYVYYCTFSLELHAARVPKCTGWPDVGGDLLV